jgi:hypothetical protein
MDDKVKTCFLTMDEYIWCLCTDTLDTSYANCFIRKPIENKELICVNKIVN